MPTANVTFGGEHITSVQVAKFSVPLQVLSEVIALKNPGAYVCDDARNYMYIQGIIADILFAGRLCTWQMEFGKKYSDQPVLSGLVDLLNLNIS